MASSLRERFEEHLTCSICLEQLKDPKVLPCLHSYCYQCIVKLAKDRDSIACQECRKTVKVGNPPDLSILPSNFFVNNLLASLSLTSVAEETKSVLCENCDTGDSAKTRCQQCGMFLCQFCTESHKRYRATKSHAVFSMNELKSSKPSGIAETIRCAKHKEEVIKLYCKTCEMTICRDCTIVDHRNHEYSFVQDVAGSEKLNLKEILDEVKQRKARILDGISNLEEFEVGLMQKKESVSYEINEHFDALIEAVQCQRRRLIEKATSLINSKQKQILSQREKLEMALATCESSIEFTDRAFKNGNDVQILSMKKYILKCLENLKTAKDQTQPCVTDHLKFIVPFSVQDIDCNLLQLHSLDDSVCCPELSTATFKEPGTLKPGKKAVITVNCCDQYRRRITYGGQYVTPKFTGVAVTDVTVIDNEDGSHDVNFVPCHNGMLECEVVINGYRATNFTLNNSVTWTLDNTLGSGTISNGGLTMMAEGVEGSYCYCYRLGDCSFNSGINTWVVQITHQHNDYYVYNVGNYGLNYSQRACGVEVGVVDNSVHQNCAMFGQNFNKWVYSFSSCKVTSVCVKLDMTKNVLLLTPYEGSDEDQTLKHELPHGTFSPFFALSSTIGTNCSVSVVV